MTCKECNEQMSLSLDNLLSDEEQQALNDHLRDCPQCQEDYALYQSIYDGLGAIEEVPLPEDFHEGLMMKIHGLSQDEAASPTPEMLKTPKITPLHRRFSRRYGNVAAVFVLVVIFALVGVSTLLEKPMGNDAQPFSADMAFEGAKEAPEAQSAQDTQEANMRIMEEPMVAESEEAPLTFSDDGGDASSQEKASIMTDEAVPEEDDCYYEPAKEVKSMAPKAEPEEAPSGRIYGGFIIGGFLLVITIGSILILRKI